MSDAATSCRRCGEDAITGPVPVRTSAHPNSSFLLVEMPGAHEHDIALEALVCKACGAADLRVPPWSLEKMRRHSDGVYEGDGEGA